MKAQHTLRMGFCDRCQWLHEVDTDKVTNFMGVRLCPLHAAAQDLLEALKNVRLHGKLFGIFRDQIGREVLRHVDAALAKATQED